MTKFKAILSIIIIVIITIAVIQRFVIYPNQNEPLDIAKNIFCKKEFPDIKKYIKGEYKGKPNMQDFPERATTKFKLLEQNDYNAVVSMTILDAKGKGFDAYLHFEKDRVWKMNAFRSLAMMDFFEQDIEMLENLTPEQINYIITQAKSNDKNDYEMFTSREDFNFKLGNSKLSIELDDNLVKYFKKNEKEFERLKNLALLEINKKGLEIKDLNLIENYKSEYHKILISAVSISDYNLRNCINFLINGVGDNTVGFIFVREKIDLPEMKPSEVIMIREIGNGWYLYKTT